MKELFRSTRWSLVDALRRKDSDWRSAQETLCRIYQPAVFEYFRSHGHTLDSADDLSQSFMIDVVLRKDVFAKADQTKGRLRAYFYESLKNYNRDIARRSKTRMKRNHAVLGELRLKYEGHDTNSQHDPELEFDRRWAISVLEEGIRKCRSYYQDEGRLAHWEVYQSRVLFPAINGLKSVSRKELAREFGFRTEADVSSVVQRVSRRLKMFIEQILAETGSHAEEHEDDLQFLRRVLS